MLLPLSCNESRKLLWTAGSILTACSVSALVVFCCFLLISLVLVSPVMIITILISVVLITPLITGLPLIRLLFIRQGVQPDPTRLGPEQESRHAERLRQGQVCAYTAPSGVCHARCSERDKALAYVFVA